MFKLNKKVKAKWVAALRSGNYQQGENSLKHGGTYCCLGVAKAIGLCVAKSQGYVDDKFLPMDIQCKLAAWNDGATLFEDDVEYNKKEVKKSFKRIATWIERYL